MTIKCKVDSWSDKHWWILSLVSGGLTSPTVWRFLTSEWQMWRCGRQWQLITDHDNLITLSSLLFLSRPSLSLIFKMRAAAASRRHSIAVGFSVTGSRPTGGFNGIFFKYCNCSHFKLQCNAVCIMYIFNFTIEFVQILGEEQVWQTALIVWQNLFLQEIRLSFN